MRSLSAEASSDGSLSIRKVLVAVNLSDHSEATTIYAAEIAKIFDASLTVGYVYQPVPLCEYASETTFTVLEDQRRDLEGMLKILTQKAQKSSVICESVFLVGEPAEQISILAREMGADLLVTACHHPAFLGQIFNLDKATPVKHQDPCPVLIYHEKTPVRANIHRNFIRTTGLASSKDASPGGSTANEISADLLMLSTHGHTGWKHLLFGSDAEKILEQAPCPVLVVR